MPKSKVYGHVFDDETERNVLKLKSDGYISELLGPIGTGKEAYVFYSHDQHNNTVAVKIHRHHIGAFKQIPTYLRLRGTGSRGYIKRIDDWTRYEFNFMSRAFNVGVSVPEPMRNYKNIIVMAFIGEDDVPAKPAVQDRNFEVDSWYKKITDVIVLLGRRRIIHGDLSPYNILNLKGNPFFIDFSQALKLSNMTLPYLVRDITTINSWFKSLGFADTKSEDELIKLIDPLLLNEQ